MKLGQLINIVKENNFRKKFAGDWVSKFKPFSIEQAIKMNRKAFMTSLWFFDLSKVCTVATKKLFKSTKITRFQYIVILTKPWKGLELISSPYKNCFAICCTSDTIFLGLAYETNWKHLKYCWERLHYLFMFSLCFKFTAQTNEDFH